MSRFLLSVLAAVIMTTMAATSVGSAPSAPREFPRAAQPRAHEPGRRAKGEAHEDRRSEPIRDAKSCQAKPDPAGPISRSSPSTRAMTVGQRYSASTQAWPCAPKRRASSGWSSSHDSAAANSRYVP